MTIAMASISNVPVIPFNIPPGIGLSLMRASIASIEVGATSVNRLKLNCLYPFFISSHNIRKSGIIVSPDSVHTPRKNILLLVSLYFAVDVNLFLIYLPFS